MLGSLPRVLLSFPLTQTINRYNHVSMRNAQSNKNTPINNIIPYQYNYVEACKRFVDIDKNRLFSPTINTFNNKSTSLTISREDPLQKVYLPFFSFRATISPVKYTARYGINRTELSYGPKGKIIMNIVTDWHYITGTLKTTYYDQSNVKSYIYGGFSYPRSDVDELLNETKVVKYMEPYNTYHIDCTVDSFKMRSSIAKKKAVNRINEKLNELIYNDINNRVRCDHIDDIQMKSYNIKIFRMTTCLFPSYILQYKLNPPRILAAIKNQEIYTGKSPLSIPKVMTASIIPSVVLSLAFPQTIAIRAVITAFCIIASGAYAAYSPSLTYNSQKLDMQHKEIDNNLVEETIDDMNRRLESEMFAYRSPDDPRLYIDPLYYDILGLDSNNHIDENIIKQAFIQKIKIYHPDVYKSDIEVLKIIAARDILLDELKIAKSMR
uniref:Chaperone protein n=1 Tax=Pithovirus LCPAC101 TaxID=2506586 RepID=A0A481Z260_9VIRU|nr:MAG: chaperone protein [Pithovirus LCPAC101]